MDDYSTHFIHKLLDGFQRGYDIADEDIRQILLKENLIIVKNEKPEWWGDPEAQIVEDCVSDAIGNCDGHLNGEQIKEQFALAGLRLVPIVDVGNLKDIKTFASALGAAYIRNSETLIDLDRIEAALTAAGVKLVPI